jgi:histidine triad (HIT) family protein
MDAGWRRNGVGPVVTCRFCEIAAGRTEVDVVFEDELSLAFLDHRPLFAGHTLLIPRQHHETLPDLPASLVCPLFLNARLLARAMETGLGAEGSFVALNNRVSQSVPHVHVHVVPRRRKDGLKGFFWPRQAYPSREAAAAVAAVLRGAVETLRRDAGH